MQNQSNQTKICNCHVHTNKNIFQSNIDHSFCEKCGSILIKNDDGNIYYTIKSIKKQKQEELDPIIIIKTMKEKTEENYPYIYNIYNNSDKQNNFSYLEKLNIYLNKRKMLLSNLQKLIKTFDFCDETFYQCLFYLDTYLSKDIYEEMSKKKLLYNLIGYFLCSAKFGEKDIFEPQFEYFFHLFSNVYLSSDKIAKYEKLCLKRINYNIFSYSAYDWITQLISNGIIFNNEIDENNKIIHINGHRHSIVNAINRYTIDLLLHFTAKNFFFKYSPMYLAFSIIQLAREKYLDNNMIKPNLFHKLINLYGVDYSDFENCYEELKSEINLDNNENSKENKNNEENNISYKKSKDIKKFSVDKIHNHNRKNNIIPSEISKNEEITIFHKDIKHNRNQIDDYNNNLNGSRNKKELIKLNHISIDCGFNSKDCAPIVNLKNKNNKKETITVKSKKNNYFSSKTKNINIKIDSHNEKNEEKKENKRDKKKAKYSTSKKLTKIYFDENINNKNNQLEHNQKYICIDKPKKYILKSDKNLGN